MVKVIFSGLSFNYTGETKLPLQASGSSLFLDIWPGSPTPLKDDNESHFQNEMIITLGNETVFYFLR
ncbi:hypothetical protein [Serratia plymuthica]|uniref:hypothetical protein n=1 Tax=Serratia plymuthica TaxID=82996 RepID=UPI0012FDB125|nr:hypothetical protein [Serratia plymuthica]